MAMVDVDVGGEVEVEVEDEDEEREARSDGTRVSWRQRVAPICQTRAYKLYTKNQNRGHMYVVRPDQSQRLVAQGKPGTI